MEAAAIALGNVTNVSAAIQSLRQRLNDLKNLTEVCEAEMCSYIIHNDVCIESESRKTFEISK